MIVAIYFRPRWEPSFWREDPSYELRRVFCAPAPQHPRSTCSVSSARPKPWAGLPDPMAGRHIGESVSQTHSFVLVLRSIGQRHTEPMTLAVQGLRLES